MRTSRYKASGIVGESRGHLAHTCTHLLTTKMASRMKRITDSAKKRRKAVQFRKSRYQMVNLRDQIDKWKEIMEENGCGNDGEVAKLLIDW